MKRKIFGIAAVIVFLCGTITLFAENGWESEYGWAADGVNFCARRDILQGDENGNYNLGNNLTKSEMAKMISKGFGLPVKNDTPRFSDISPSQWAYQYILNIQEYIVDNSGAYQPFKYATRQEFISAVVFASGTVCENADTGILTKTFTDSVSVSDMYRESVSAAVYCGYIKGDRGLLRPNDNLTRAEVCVMLNRILNSEHLSCVPTKKPEEPIPDDIMNKLLADRETPAPTVAEQTPSRVTTTTPILAESQHTLEQAQAWAKRRGAAQRFIDIAPYYWYYGDVFGIRADVMYAQAAKETAFGKYTGKVSPEMNNWAGIKKYGAVGDATEDHESFATPEDGVRGHFNHMSAYVGVAPVGETHGRYASVKSLSWAGTVKYVEELGGKWCPNPDYGYSILYDYVYQMGD